MIPVLIAPAYNRHDLLERMLLSVDHRVGRILIVDNGRNYEPTINFGSTIWRPPFQSIGYGGAINFGITQTAEQPWWLWASNDVVFDRGTLSKIVDQIEYDTKPRVVTGAFTWGAVNQAAIAKVGLIDDWNFYPIYYDDNDYEYRCKLAGIEWVEWGMDGITHGEDGLGSVTIRSDEAMLKANHSSFDANQRRYIEKWGGLPGEERFKTPYGRDLPLDFTRPDLLGRSMRVW